MTDKVIFLDFDGVLNTEQNQTMLAAEGKKGKDLWGPKFDPNTVKNLETIIHLTGAKIVLSSSWRYLHSLESLKRMWEIRKLPGELLDTIPCGASYISPGEEIECWLNSHGNPRYVILDDIDDFLQPNTNTLLRQILS